MKKVKGKLVVNKTNKNLLLNIQSLITGKLTNEEVK